MLMKPVLFETQTQEIAGPGAFVATNFSGAAGNVGEGLAVLAAVTVTTSAAKTFTANVNDQLSITAHGFKTGLKGQVTTTLTIPLGLSLLTDYYVIVVDADNIKLATSLANATAGTAVDLTGVGTGVLTFTPTALAGCSMNLYGSMDNITFADTGVTKAITGSGNYWLEKDRPYFNYFRVYYALTAGQISVVQQTLVKGY